MKNGENPVAHLKHLAEAVDTDLARLEDSVVDYVRAAHDASRAWVHSHGHVESTQMINRQIPDNRGRGGAVYARAAIDRVVERAFIRARTGSDPRSLAMVHPKLAERHV